MSIGWGGADPTVATDSTAQEMGTEYIANQDITITKVRVWAHSTEEGFVGREGRIWTTGGSLLATAVMPDTLPSGWSSYDLSVPVERLTGEKWVVTYSTGGRYGFVSQALASSVPSPNGAVTALASSLSTNGNGVFTTTPETFPTLTFNNTFYGIDVEFDLGVGAGNAPVITGVDVTSSGLSVTATVNATDVDGLTGATYLIEWGDGQTSSGTHPNNSFTHTYTTAGLKAILAKVTDSTARSDYHAAAVLLFAESAFDPTAIIDAVASHAAATGDFDIVNKHEPKSAPGRGLSAHIWAQHLGTARAQSGLSITSAILVLNVRIMSNMLAEPQDDIDPEILRAVNRLMAAYSADFTLGGLVREIDLLGITGQTLRADAGYVRIGGGEGGMYRVMVITVPMIINDVWPQAA